MTASEAYKQVLNYSPDDLKAYSDYFFGQQDPTRMVIQRDVDIPLVPATDGGDYYFKLCAQQPVILFYGSDRIITFLKGWNFYADGTANFNYEHAIFARAGAEIQLDAGDFGLDAFSAKTTFAIVDHFAGKQLAHGCNVTQFNPQKTTAAVVLPASLQTLAYRITCATPGRNDAVSAKWVVITE